MAISLATLSVRPALVGEHLAVAHHHPPPRVRRDVGLVRDHDHGVAGARELVEQRHDLLRRGRVEVAGGLVGEQDRRTVDQRARDGDALALPARELVGMVAHAVLEADALERLGGAPAALGARHPRVDHRQLDVLERGGARQQMEGLEHEPDLAVADAGELVLRGVLDRLLVEAIGAGAGRVEAADQVHQRRLAAARGAHDGEVLALLDVEVDAGERADGLRPHHVGLGEAAQLDSGIGRRVSRTVRSPRARAPLPSPRRSRCARGRPAPGPRPRGAAR